MVSQRDWANPPKFEPLPYRLADAADGPRPFTGHQKLGVMFEPNPCTFPLETSTACLTGSGDAKEPTAEVNWRGANPFAIYTWLPCGLVSLGREELERLTLGAHQNNAQTIVERVFWSGGDFQTSQFLATDTEVIVDVVGGSQVTLQTGATTLITGSAGVAEAIGLLESAMAGCYGGRPLIHIPRIATPHLAKNHLIKEQGQFIRTIGNNSTIIPAPGYENTGPDGTEAPDGFAWFYATGSVAMWESPVTWYARETSQILDRSVNATSLIAEQWFMFGWDCCHFAVLVNLSE